MSEEELWELMSVICEGQDSEQRRKVEQYITDLQKEIERLNNIITYLEQYFSKREYYEFAELVRETKEANIEWLENAIKEDK